MIFLLSSAGLVYVIAGYPLLLDLLARWFGRPFRTGDGITPSVSVILPVYNGGRWLAGKLETLLALDYPRSQMEIIVISDGSTDETAPIARQYAEHYPVRLIEISRGGKAVAINAGMRAATGEILFFTDVRQQLEPMALQHLVNCFADPEVGVATGELMIRDGETREEANVGLYWKYEKWIRRRLSLLDSVLGATGCIYAMRRSLAKPLPAGTLLDDVHLPLQAFAAGYRIVMEEKAQAFDTPTGLGVEFRRKVRTQAGMYQILRWFPRMLLPGTRMWLHFISYKFARLMLPLMLVGMAVGSLWLPDPWRWWTLGVQGVFYALAVLNRVVPHRSALKRITAPVSTFVTLVGAAFFAASILIVPPEKLWRAR